MLYSITYTEFSYVEFSSPTVNVSKTAGSLVVTLVASGNIPTQSFNVIVIAEADNSSVSPATGMLLRFGNRVVHISGNNSFCFDQWFQTKY